MTGPYRGEREGGVRHGTVSQHRGLNADVIATPIRFNTISPIFPDIRRSNGTIFIGHETYYQRVCAPASECIFLVTFEDVETVHFPFVMRQLRCYLLPFKRTGVLISASQASIPIGKNGEYSIAANAFQ